MVTASFYYSDCLDGTTPNFAATSTNAIHVLGPFMDNRQESLDLKLVRSTPNSLYREGLKTHSHEIPQEKFNPRVNKVFYYLSEL